MTTAQLQTLLVTMRRLEDKVDRIEDRLAFVYPTEREMQQQLDAEVAAILSPGGSLKVFADD